MYKVTVEERKTRLIPDLDADRPKHFKKHDWETVATTEGDAQVVAATLRALADKLDPRKPTVREGIHRVQG